MTASQAGDFESLARQYWAAWGEALRTAAPAGEFLLSSNASFAVDFTADAGHFIADIRSNAVPLPLLATYSRVPSGLSASALGAVPTEMSCENQLGLASIRFPVVVLITDTVLLPVLAT